MAPAATAHGEKQMKLYHGQLVLIDDHGIRVARVQYVNGDTAHLHLQGQL